MSGIEITRLELTAVDLCSAAGKSRDAKAARRMLALALVLEGLDRTRAVETCGMDRQRLRGEPGKKTVWGTVFPANARVGQQGTLTRIWARRGTRPRAPRDTHYQWAYPFGAVCPSRGVVAGLVLPFVNTAAMNAHLAEVARHASRRSSGK